MILSVFANPASAAENLWQSTFGQRWFYEVRSYSGEVVAGTWWEQSLTPGNTYTISFNVKNLRGKIGLLVGDDPAIPIDRAGNYSFDFNVSSGGKRRMLFRTLSSNVMASVNSISVTPKWDSTAQSSGGSSGGGGGGGSTWLPKGHYLSLDRERNLKTEMQTLVQQPGIAKSNYHLNRARALHDALKTPGIKGLYMEFEWRSLEVGDGKFNWSALDANVDVARQYGLKFIVKIADRSFNGTNVLPGYFPSKYALWSSGGGKSGVVSKRWDPWVYNRLIRLHKAIANRYAGNAGFGGIATAETAMGYSGGDYSISKYRTALTQIVNQTQAALKNGKLFLYMNFLKGGDNSDMNRDQRVALLKNVPHGSLAIGGPDITPDVQGMPRSVTAYRIHSRKKFPGLSQFCHFQHVDQGLGGINRKTNKHRQAYFAEVARVQNREKQYWFKGTPAVFEFDDLRDPNGNKVKLHPNWALGDLWKPDELFDYAKRNFDCDYYFWHFREQPKWSEFGWFDVRPVVLNNQYIQ